MKKMPLPALVAVALVAAVVLGVAAGFGATGVARTFEQLAGAAGEKSASNEKDARTHAASDQGSDAAREAGSVRAKSEGDAMAGGCDLVNVENLQAERASASSIELAWDAADSAEGYEVERRTAGSDTWEAAARIDAAGAAGTGVAWTDELDSTEPQQYFYRVRAAAAAPQGEKRASSDDAGIPASNLLVCLDPGHYAGCNEVPDAESPYCEGDFTLEVALALRDELAETYGVTCVMTRETGSITLGGMSDEALDNTAIQLRGEAAADCDLFISLHTNANLDNANGAPTFEQPTSITKPIVLANPVAASDERALAVANAIGEEVADASARLGIARKGAFDPVRGPQELRTWSDAFNDSTIENGTVSIRRWNGGDYYGVLRGAANVSVPGFIVEHGHHTVPEMRQAAAEGTLAPAWAEADARGIARGYGFEAAQ